MILTPIPAFKDNYIWALQNASYVVVVDPGDPQPVTTYLQKNNCRLSGILITHHHPDHVGGVQALLEQFSVPVFAPASGSYEFPHQPVSEGNRIYLLELNYELEVIEVPGHTLDHIAYLGNDVLFCGDTLFGGGCGRVFEGTMDMMHSSLQRLANLSPETAVCCAHEYTLANLAFAQSVDPSNTDLLLRIEQEKEKRMRSEPTLPSTIGLERKTNVFLRAKNAAEFARLRQAKDDA
jgi:hydroxyacylglutathione hydrolase